MAKKRKRERLGPGETWAYVNTAATNRKLAQEKKKPKFKVGMVVNTGLQCHSEIMAREVRDLDYWYELADGEWAVESDLRAMTAREKG